MSHAPATFDQLYSELRTATTQEQLVDLIHRVAEYVAGNDSDAANDYDRLRLRAFIELVDLTKARSVDAQRLIITELLPLCIDDSAPIEVPHVWRYHEVLVDWLAEIGSPEGTHVRDVVIDALLECLNGAGAENAIWLLGQIGYRSQKITDRLWDLIAKRDDKASDAALAALAAYGPAVVGCDRLRDIANQRIADRFSMGLLRTLQHLASPESIEPIRRSPWFEPSGNDGKSDRSSLALGLLIDIADIHWEDEPLQDQVWQVVSELVSRHQSLLSASLYLGSDIAPRCDSPSVIASLLDAYSADIEPGERTQYRHYLLCCRLSECVRPRQLAAWGEMTGSSATPLLLEETRRDTQTNGLWRTQAIDLKEAAWHVLLNMGNATLLQEVDTTLRDETNAFMQAAICDIAACFRLDPLPPVIRDWIVEPYNAPRDEASFKWAARMAAIRVARSVASRGAFDALLHSGFTFEGRLLRQSVEALTDVATSLLAEGNSDVLDALVEMARRGGDPKQRTAAIGSLSSIARLGGLEQHHTEIIAQLVNDSTLTSFELSVLIEALGYVESSVLTPALISRLEEWARGDVEDVIWRTLETMARQNLLLAHPDILATRLAVQRDGETWTIMPQQGAGRWDGYIIGLLYDKHRAMFTPIIATLLREGDWQTAAQVAGVLRGVHGDIARAPVPEEIRDALLWRLLHGQRYSTVETEMFGLAALLAPDTLSGERWEDIYDDWRPEARAALAEALAAGRYSQARSVSRAVTLLTRLTEDGRYGVRRAAYRGIHDLAPETLIATCAAWQESDDKLLRERAAEAIGWVASDMPSTRQLADLQRKLATDPERSVRDTLMTALHDQRERQWAQRCVERVRKSSRGENGDILRAWPYGQALLQIGNDDCARLLQEGLTGDNIPPHVRHWWQQLIEGIEERWRKVTEKWPDPWHKWEGVLDEGDGVILVGDDTGIPIHYRIWYQAAAAMSEVSGWNGTAEAENLAHINVGDEYTLRLHDQRQGTILITGTSSHVGQGSTFTFGGQHAFPT